MIPIANALVSVAQIVVDGWVRCNWIQAIHEWGMVILIFVGFGFLGGVGWAIYKNVEKRSGR